jgi:hypothetical protein
MKEYSKPTVFELGDANRLIQGSKPGQGDAQSSDVNIRQECSTLQSPVETEPGWCSSCCCKVLTTSSPKMICVQH